MATPHTWLNHTGLRITFVDETGFPVTSLEPDGFATADRVERLSGTTLVNETEVLVVDHLVGLARALPEPAPGVGIVVLGAVVEAVGFTRTDLWEPHEVLPSGADGGINCRGLARHRLA